MNHQFKINERTVTLTILQMVAIWAILKLVPEGWNAEKSGNKVRAIKFTRELLAIGLKEAKDLVNIIEAQGSLDINGYVQMKFPDQKSVEYLGPAEHSYPSASDPGSMTLGELLRDKLKTQAFDGVDSSYEP